MEVTHQIRQQHTSQSDLRNRNIPNQEMICAHKQLKVTVRTHMERLSFGLTHLQTKVVTKVSQINSLTRCSLLSSNLSFRGGSLHLEICFHFAAPTIKKEKYAAENMALFCSDMYLCERPGAF